MRQGLDRADSFNEEGKLGETCFENQVCLEFEQACSLDAS